GEQVGLGEVPVVLGLLLGAAGSRGRRVLMPVTGLLDHGLASEQQLCLSSGLMVNGPLNSAQRVDVLSLRALAERHRGLCRSVGRLGTQGEVDVGAKATLLHAAIGDA